jgi:hypothetical protein
VRSFSAVPDLANGVRTPAMMAARRPRDPNDITLDSR